MKYTALFKPRAFKDMKPLSETDRNRIYAAVSRLEDNLKGDVAKYEIIIYRVVHRREAYKKGSKS